MKLFDNVSGHVYLNKAALAKRGLKSDGFCVMSVHMYQNRKARRAAAMIRKVAEVEGNWFHY